MFYILMEHRCVYICIEHQCVISDRAVFILIWSSSEFIFLLGISVLYSYRAVVFIS